MTDESQKILAMRRHNQYYLHPFGWVVSSVVEQLAFNQLVVGSTPTRPTIRTCWLVYEPWVVSSVVEQLAFNQLVVGSTPTRPTTFSTRKAPLWRFFCLLFWRLPFTVRACQHHLTRWVMGCQAVPRLAHGA